MALTFFSKLRERQEKRALEKARREGAEAGRKHAEVVARAEWASAALSLAEKTGDVELIRKCCESAVAANDALTEMHREELAEIVRILDLIQSQPVKK